MMNATLGKYGSGVRTVLMLVFALAAWALPAGRTALSEKSYFIDTRRPVVALSEAGRLDTNRAGVFIMIR